jgi:hypothetical protein
VIGSAYLKSVVSGAVGLLRLATINPHLQFGYPPWGQMGPIHAEYAVMDAQEIDSASRSTHAPTRLGNIGLSRELRCRFLRTALAQRITLGSELITLPGPVTVIARSALAFLDWLLDHHSQPLS